MRVNRSIDGNGELGKSSNYSPCVRIYADASCIRNGAVDSSSGCGVVLVDQNRLEIKLVAKYLGQTTNQQAEILACTKALEQLCRPCKIEIVSDSLYVIDTMTGLNRMKTNLTFWGGLVKGCYGHHVSWRWVKGHSGVLLQEVADRLARASARICGDLLAEELESLSNCLSINPQSCNLREFEIELAKIITRYTSNHQTPIPPPTFDVAGTLPSAFFA